MYCIEQKTVAVAACQHTPQNIRTLTNQGAAFSCVASLMNHLVAYKIILKGSARHEKTKKHIHIHIYIPKNPSPRTYLGSCILPAFPSKTRKSFGNASPLIVGIYRRLAATTIAQSIVNNIARPVGSVSVCVCVCKTGGRTFVYREFRILVRGRSDRGASCIWKHDRVGRAGSVRATRLCHWNYCRRQVLVCRAPILRISCIALGDEKIIRQIYCNFKCYWDSLYLMAFKFLAMTSMLICTMFRQRKLFFTKSKISTFI